MRREGLGVGKCGRCGVGWDGGWMRVRETWLADKLSWKVVW